MDTEYRISQKTELRNFKGIFPLFFLLLIMPLLSHYLESNEDTSMLIAITLGLIMLFFIPQAIIHMKFYSLDKNKILEIDRAESKIKITENGKKTSFAFDEIKNVFHYTSPPLAEKRMKWFPWDSYNYSKIFLNNGDVIIITSLLVLNLELPVGDKCEIIKTFYAYPK